MAKVRCTVVVLVFNESLSIAPMSARLSAVLNAEDLDWQVLFVDDGSTDDSYEEIKKLNTVDPRFTALRFSRNFGSHIAISAGLEHATGEVAILTTADQEEPPESIPALLAMWREGYQLVWGIRARRATRGLSHLGSKLYHLAFRWFASMAPGQDEIGGGLFIADRRVLDAVRRFPERNRNIIGLLLWAGFKQGRYVYEPEPRKFGRSKWTLAKKVRLVLDTLVGFSVRPLRLLLGSGFAALALGLVGIVIAVVDVIFAGKLSPLGVVAAILGVTFACAGVQLASVGLLGEYLWRALDESRGRPLYLVMDRLGVSDPKP